MFPLWQKLYTGLFPEWTKVNGKQEILLKLYPWVPERLTKGDELQVFSINGLVTYHSVNQRTTNNFDVLYGMANMWEISKL